jgi:hypothetical protein
MKIEHVTIGWEKNGLTSGEDDPHKGTPYEGTYAVLKVRVSGLAPMGMQYISFRVSDFAYSDDIRGIIGQIMMKFRQCRMCGCVPKCSCDELMGEEDR